MKKLGKVIVGSALLGAAAYGAHVYLNRLEQEEDIFEQDAPEDRAPAPSYTELEEAASRAYTTIQHGSRQAMEKVREAVGPKGGEVMDEIGAAAREMGKTVRDSADKIKDILQSRDEEAEEPEEETEEPAAEGGFAKEPEEASPYVVLKSVKTAGQEGTSRTAEAAAAQARDLARAADEGKVEEFFDDEDDMEVCAEAAE